MTGTGRIELVHVIRDRIADRNAEDGYSVFYNHPRTGEGHHCGITREAIVCRARMLNLSYEDATRVLMAALHCPPELPNDMHRNAYEVRDEKVGGVLRAAAQRSGSATRAGVLDQLVDAVEEASAEPSLIGAVEAAMEVADNDVWKELMQMIEEDSDKMELADAMDLARIISPYLTLPKEF